MLPYLFFLSTFSPENKTPVSLGPRPFTFAMAKSSTSAAEERVPEDSEITTSRSITVTESTATLSLEVTDYPKLKGMGVGQFIKSRVFKVGGNDWEMRF